MQEDRLEKLEILTAEQEKTIEELSDQIARQWELIERMQKKLELLTERFLALEERAAPESRSRSRPIGDSAPTAGEGCSLKELVGTNLTRLEAAKTVRLYLIYRTPA